tara:strand:+ start:2409 stop:3122 length:714 start_codon:yes stop_codon:yes gene_type:complete
MKILILGDIHSLRKTATKLIEHAYANNDIVAILQVGDLGIGCDLPIWRKPSIMKHTALYYVDGNHDNYNVCVQENPVHGWLHHIDRGQAIGIGHYNILGCGGAYSIDHLSQAMHGTWWKEEEPTYAQWMTILENTEKFSQNTNIDVVVSHEFPISFNAFINQIKKSKNSERMRQGLQQMLDIMTEKPKWWFFGHHHIRLQGKTNSTQWVCVPDVRTGVYATLDLNQNTLAWHTCKEK